MDDITITIRPYQRAILINALAHWVDVRRDKYDINEVRELHNMVGNTKCGDRYCQYCGDLKYDDNE